jgi:hypothetical protein
VGLRYFDHPRIAAEDVPGLVEELAGTDLVILDSQRKFLTDFGLNEDSSGDLDYFMVTVIEPFFLARIATLILDNTGHKDESRGRGSSAKRDLGDVIFTMSTAKPFSVEATGAVRLEVSLARPGVFDTWRMELGGGRYGSWTGASAAGVPEEFASRVLAALWEAGPKGLSYTALREQAGVQTARVKDLLSQLVAQRTILRKGDRYFAAEGG